MPASRGWGYDFMFMYLIYKALGSLSNTAGFPKYFTSSLSWREAPEYC